MASNPYNEWGANPDAFGSKTYSKSAVKAGKVNPYDDYGATNRDVALQEQKQRQQSEQPKQQSVAQQVVTKQQQQVSQSNPPAPSKPSTISKVASKVGSFLKSNIVKPVEETAKLPGNVGSLVAGEVTGNKQATSNAKQALGSSYSQSVPQAITSGAADVVKQANKNIVQPIVHPDQYRVKGGVKTIMSAQTSAQQAVKDGKVHPGVLKAVDQIQSPQDKINAYKLLADSSLNDDQKFQKLNPIIQKQSAQVKKAIGDALQIASLAIGAPEAKAAVTGAEDVAAPVVEKSLLNRALTSPRTIGTLAGATGNIGSELAANPNASAKDLAKSGAAGGAFALGTIGAGELVHHLNPLTKTDLTPEKAAVVSQLSKAPEVNAIVDPKLVDDHIVKPGIAHVPASALSLGSDTLHTSIDKTTVAKYVDDIRSGNPINPIVISREKDGQIMVQDGKHRLEAMKQAGVKDIPVVEKTSVAARAEPPPAGALKPLLENTPRNTAVQQAFNKSTGQVAVGNKNDINFELGSFGRNHSIRKGIEGKGDRFPVSELETTVNHITNAYKASNQPNSYRSDNIAWVAEMPNGEKRIVYTRQNAKGNEEVINWHKVDETKNPNYLSTLESYGDPAQTRTGGFGLERRAESVPQGPNKSIQKSSPVVKSPGETGSTTLQVSAVPGVPELVQQDIIPKVKGAVKAAGAAAKNVRDIVSPASIDKNAAETALEVRRYRATPANKASIEAANGKSAFKFFNRQKTDENIANRSSYERTGKFSNEPTKGYSQLYHDTTEAAYRMNQETYGKNDLGHVENYIKRNFDLSAKDEAKATQILYNTSHSLKPGDSSIKHRVLDMPTDEALAVLKSKGIKAKLITDNPEISRQQTIASAVQAKGYKDLGDNLKETGLVKFVPLGKQTPGGFVKLNDRAFSSYFPSEAGMVKAGEYYAPEGAAKILNNAISSGLEGHAIYRGLRNIKNNLNLLQLGVSAFHAGTTTLNASINDLVGGLRSGISGHPLKGAGQFGRGIVPGASVIRQTYLGSKAFKEFKLGNPEAAKVLENSINPSGFRLRMENRYKTSVTENMVKAFKNNNYWGGLARTPFAAIEQSTRPIMEHLVPNAKLGAMLDRAKQIQELHPNASPKELAAHLAKASDSMDNIYGQLVYDNLFWNKTFKDLAMLSQRSVGWNLGTIREIGGGITDIGTKTLRGKGVTDKTLFAASLPLLVGTYGAVYQYLHTGKGPDKLLDYFYPKNGLQNKNGDPDRVALPSYMKDVYAYAKDPKATIGHKLSPGLSVIKDIISNQDFYGNMVRNPDDSKAKQLEQAGAYVVKQMQPFSIQQSRKLAGENASKVQQVEAFSGIVPAPGSVEKTGFANKVATALHQAAPPKSLTPEQQAQVASINNPKSGTLLQRQFSYLLLIDRSAAAKILATANKNDIKQVGDVNQLKVNMASTINNKNSKPDTKAASQKILDLLGGGDVNSLSQTKKDQQKSKRQLKKLGH